MFADEMDEISISEDWDLLYLARDRSDAEALKLLLAENGIEAVVESALQCDVRKGGFEERFWLRCPDEDYDLAYDFMLSSERIAPSEDEVSLYSISQTVSAMDDEELQEAIFDERDQIYAGIAKAELVRRGYAITAAERTKWRARVESSVPKETAPLPFLVFAVIVTLIIPPFGFIGCIALLKSKAIDGSVDYESDLRTRRVARVMITIAVVGTLAIIAITALGC